MDFGLAKERKAGAELQKLTATGIILGTPEFMSPEQLRGKPLDARTDIYSLALMTYEMLTRQAAVRGAHAAGDDDRASAQRSDSAAEAAAGARFPRGDRACAVEGDARANPTSGIRRRSSSRRRSPTRRACGNRQARTRRPTRVCSDGCLAASRSARLCAVLCAAALSSSAFRDVHAQRSRPYRPAFDVSDYALTIDLPDTGSTIHGTALLTVARVAHADTLKLDLLDLDVSGVSVDGRAAKFARTTDGIDIVLPSRKSTAATFEVSVEYGGAVKDGLIVRQDSTGRWTYFGDNWPNRARHWIPSIDHPSDKATVTWRVRAPAARTVIANGRLVSRKPIRDAAGGDRVETVWRESKPIAPYLMVIAAAPLTEYDVGDTACGLAESQRCVPQFVYVAPEQRNFLPGPFARVGEIVQLFARLVGPFPYEKLAHLQSSTRFGGMENASAIFYADGGFRRGTMRDGVVAHETAHQWFGDAVTERDWPHLWLSEGFATYFAALWTRAARGDSAFRGEMANDPPHGARG